MSRQYRAPAANRAVLAEPHFDAIPALVEANRKLLDRADVVIAGLPLRELRALARREALEEAVATGRAPQGADAGPLLVAGHQPELSHPGVWVKNFALNGLAKRLGGVPLNLVVDTDTLKSASLPFPTFRDRDPHSVRLESLAFDTFAREVPYEDRTVNDAAMFASFADRAAPLWANWGYRPLLTSAWPYTDPHSRQFSIGDRFFFPRLAFECDWGCDNTEVFVSALALTEGFARFATHILGDLPRFREVYNAAIRAYREANGIRSANHPAPELAEGEAPFWVHRMSGHRERATATSNVRILRPRALTLTLFARVCLGDFFIHGIGGGKYDEVTDAIIRGYFGIEPPAYQVLSATLHLPLPGFPSAPDDLTRAGRRVRDLHWNPQRHLSAEQLALRDVKALVDAHARLAANEPPFAHHAARREWYRALKEVNERLRPLVASEVPVAEAELARVRSEADANAILQRRDYAWVLYPEEFLQQFLQQFL
jgi:hypothetical protein